MLSPSWFVSWRTSQRTSSDLAGVAYATLGSAMCIGGPLPGRWRSRCSRLASGSPILLKSERQCPPVPPTGYVVLVPLRLRTQPARFRAVLLIARLIETRRPSTKPSGWASMWKWSA